MSTRREFLSLALAFPFAARGGLARAQAGSTPLAGERGSPTIRALDFSPDGRKLAAVGDVIRVWDLGGASSARRLPGADWDADHVAFLRDGRSLICGDMNGFLWRVDLAIGKQVWRTSVGEEVLSLVAAPDGGSFFCGLDEHLQQRSATSGRVLREFGPGALFASELAIAPSGVWIAGFCGDEAAELVVWNVASGAAARRFRVPEYRIAVAFARDSRSVSWIARSESEKAYQWSSADLASGAVETKPFHLPETFADTGGIALNGDRLALSAAGAAAIWDLVKDAPVWSVEIEAELEARAFGLSRDGKTIAFAEPDGSATLRDAATGASLRKLVF
jgi:WD40 repeat protein